MLIAELNSVFQEVFDDKSLAINAQTSAHNINGWDSVTHISLIVAIEKHFNIRFTTSEIAKIQTVGEMLTLISLKLKK